MVLGKRSKFVGYIYGILLVTEAGGKISKLNGNKWTTKDRDILASNNYLHNDLVGKLSLQ